MTPPLRIGPGGDVTVEGDDHGVTVRVTAPPPDAGDRPGGPVTARVEGGVGEGGRVALGGWGVTEALRRGAVEVRGEHLTDGASVAGAAAWYFGWDRTDWDELAAAVVAGRILARSRPDTTVDLQEDGTFLVLPASVDEVTARILDGVAGAHLVEPDATIRLYSVRVAAATTTRDGVELDGVLVHSVRGLPAPAEAVVTDDEPLGWRAAVTFAVAGPDPDAIAAAVWEAAGGSVEVRFTRRERTRPTTWADTVAELRASVTAETAAEAETALTSALEAVTAAELPGVAPVSDRPPVARPVTDRRVRPVPTTDVTHEVVVGDERFTVPPAPTRPPPLARRTTEATAPPPAPTRRVAPTVSTHPETIAALRDDLSRRRLASGPAEDDSVHWDAQPTRQAPLGALVRARSARSTDTGAGSVGVAVWVDSADAYDWLAWHLDLDRFRGMLPSQAVAAVERIELPNLYALAFVLDGHVDAPPALLGEHVRAQVVDLPDELYPSSALRTSAT